MTPAQGQAVADRMGATYIECSAKESKGVDSVFELAINTVVTAEDNFKAERARPSGGGAWKDGKKLKKRSCKIL